MNKTLTYGLCLALFPLPFLYGADATKSITRNELVGSYSSVTESECNIQLQLLKKGNAKIVQTCLLEDGSHKNVVKETDATWSSNKDKLVVKYSNVTDTFLYRPSISYSDFGGEGAGPGLERVGTPDSTSKLSGYGQLWKEPIKSQSKG